MSPPRWAIACVPRHKKRGTVPGYLNEHRKMRIEAVLPIDLEAKTVDIERLALGIVGHAQRGHNTLTGLVLSSFHCHLQSAMLT